MIRRTSAALTLTTILFGCGTSVHQAAQTKSPGDPAGKETAAPEGTGKEAGAALKSTTAEVDKRDVRPEPVVGDFLIHRYSGSYRSQPLLVSERVISRDGELSTIEYIFEEPNKRTTLRAQKLGADVFSVVRIEGDDEVEMPIESFERQMAMTLFSADSNEGKLGSIPVTVIVAGKEVQAVKTSYRVLVGDELAVLKIITSEQFPGRDLGGELSRPDGTLLYRAELLEAGNDASEPSVARNE